MKILIAEDEKPIADLIRMGMKLGGYECRCVYDGKEAADIIERERFDLVLCDIMMPVVDGYELLEYIRYCDIPLIFITAETSVDNRAKGLKMGAEDYISKLFEMR